MLVAFVFDLALVVGFGGILAGIGYLITRN